MLSNVNFNKKTKTKREIGLLLDIKFHNQNQKVIKLFNKNDVFII